MIAAQPFLLPAAGQPWTEVHDGNPTAFALFRRHYSFGRSARVPDSETRIAGPGEKMLLLTADARALFVWRKFISKDAQTGVNCAAFRNEGPLLSSDLIRAAMALAWRRWPGERFYTYVNPRKVRSPNPGYCFQRAGWRRCGVTKTRRLVILEALPAPRITAELCQRCGACCSAVVDGVMVACRHLEAQDGRYRCRIYAARPLVCREFDCLRDGEPSPAIATRVRAAMGEGTPA